jgi:glycosyltransferase involved in cell wall biosynthesis
MKTESSLKTAVVIPCYNEERRLNPDAFVNALSSNPNLTFIFVNDGSTDNTLQVVQKICQASPDRALSLSLNKNAGKGEAVRQGMLFLSGKKTYDVIGFWDADLSVHLDEINDFAEKFSRPEIHGVIGSRVHLSGRKIERINIRHYVGRLFATVMCFTFDMYYYDTQCGAKLFRNEVIAPVIQHPFNSRWIFDIEILIRISRLPFWKEPAVIYEMPVSEWKDVAGTKRTLSAYLTAIADYLALCSLFNIFEKPFFLKLKHAIQSKIG